jgi:LysR family transcriptional regulator, regulator for bpeEF and oprC
MQYMVSKSTTDAITLSDLRVFAKAVEMSGLALAARQLGLPKASASRQLQRLESALGRRLVHRNGRRFVLTEEGRSLLPRVQQVLADLDEAVEGIRAQSGPLQGILRIAAPYNFGRTVLGPLLSRFLAQHPALSLSLELGSGHVDLLKDQADVAIRIGAAGSESLIARRLSSEEIVFCAAPSYLRTRSEPERIEELAEHRVLDFRIDPLAREIDAVCDAMTRRVTVAPVLRSNEPEVLVRAAREGMGIAIVPASFIADDLRRGDLLRILPQWGLPAREINALYAPGRAQSPKVRAFLDFLVTALKA